jgi:hypothetical protein
MDRFDVSRFHKDFFKFPEKAFGYLFNQVDSGTISFSEFFNTTQKKYTIGKIISSWLKTNMASKHFVIYLKEEYRTELLYLIKDAKAFQSRIHYPVIADCFSDDPATLKEFAYWKNLWTALDDEIGEARRILAKYNFEDVLVLCSLYYDKLRLIEGLHKNHDSSIVEVVNLILIEKITSLARNEKEIKSKYDPVRLRARSLELLLRLRHDGDREIELLFHIFDKKADLQHLYEYYCCHEFQLSFFDSRAGVLKPADEYRYLKYMTVGQRYFIWQSYYHNLIFYEFDEVNEKIDASEMSWYNKRAHINTCEHFSQFTDAGFPVEIETDDSGKIDALNCFMAINSISSWSNIRWNNFLEEEIFRNHSRNPYELIWQLMEYNLEHFDNDAISMLFRSHKELMETAEKIHHFKKGEAKMAFALFTSNLNLNENIDLSSKPFIKLGSNIYWIAGMMANKNYAVMLQNILLERDKAMDKEGPRNKYATQTEKLLAEWFGKNKFTCEPNFEYFLDDINKTGKGEIDLLAYKDGTLFICQVKSTFHRATIKEIHGHFGDERSGIKKAIKQLERDIEYVRSNWRILKNELKADCSIDVLRIVPLAVTTTLEPGDGKFEIMDIKGYVVPLFELRVILTNTKFYLFNLSELALKARFGGQIPVKYLRPLTGIKDDPKITEEITEIVLQYAHKKKPQFNLWADGHKLCDPEDLIQAIEKESVWDMIKGKSELSMSIILIGNYTLNYFR